MKFSGQSFIHDLSQARPTRLIPAEKSLPLV